MEVNFRYRTRSKVRRIVVVSCVLWRKVFFWRHFLLLKVYKFHHTMLVLNAFLAISRGLKFKNLRGSMPPDPPSWLTLTRSKGATTKAPRPLPQRLARSVPFGPSGLWIAPPRKKTWLQAWVRNKFILKNEDHISIYLTYLTISTDSYIFSNLARIWAASSRSYWISPKLKITFF